MSSDQSGRCGSSATALAEVGHVAGTVLEADDARIVHGGADGLQLEGDLGERRHVVEEQRQRQLGHQVVEILPQLRLAARQVVRRRRHDRLRPGVRREPGEGQRLDKRGVGDADEHRHALADLTADALDEFAPQTVAEAGAFARRAEDEQPAHAASEHVLDEPLEAGDVEFIPAPHRRDHRGHDAGQRPVHRVCSRRLFRANTSMAATTRAAATR